MKIRIFCGYFFSFLKVYAGRETRINNTLSSKGHFVKKKTHVVTLLCFTFYGDPLLDPLYIHTPSFTVVKQYDFSCPSVSSRTYLQSESAVKEEKPCPSVKASGPFVNVPAAFKHRSRPCVKPTSKMIVLSLDTISSVPSQSYSSTNYNRPSENC